MYAVKLADDAELRPLEPWQAEEILAHIDRARPTVDPWIPWATLSHDLDSARATLQRYADRQAADTGRIYGIWLDGTLIGGVMFVTFDAAGGTAEIGCWLEAAGEGRGLIVLAMRQLIGWAFEQRGLARIEWRNTTTNLRSAATAERLGMTLEGVLREAYPYRGVRHDKQVWALLAAEWKAG
jgi:RimJ/RimL family protein N-acetyltransferase